MKKSIFKKTAAVLASVAVLAFTPALAGCFGFNGRDGADGKDGLNGKDLTIYDIWQETKVRTNNPDLTYDEFLKEYLSFSSEVLEQSSSLQGSINRSLMSGVSIITTFDEYANVIGFGGYHQVVKEASYYGSGVILDVNRQSGDMIVVTNCHVVYSASARTSTSGVLDTANGFAKSVDLWLYGSEFIESNAIKADIIGASKSYDLAVLKVSGSDLVKSSQAVAAQWCGGEECFVGETVYAVGNADGKKLSSSVGYISKDSEEVTVDMGSSSRSEEHTYRVLRTDTAINGGNSGGGLFNKYGELVGIVNAKTIAQEIDNMGYALPAATCKRVVQRMISDNSPNYGVEVVTVGLECEVTHSYTTGLNANGLAEIKEVITVSGVKDDSPLRNKINTGDILKNITVRRNGTVIENTDIRRMHNITDALISVNPNDGVTFTVERDGQTLDITVSFQASSFDLKD